MARFVPRRRPATGVIVTRDRATIVFVTVCSQHRSQRLANPALHEALVRAWSNADAWLVGAYVIMPDHLHLFCSPMNEEVQIEQWITFWKRQFRKHAGPDAPKLQAGAFHHRLRQDESYAAKWDYVRANPVRAWRTVLHPQATIDLRSYAFGCRRSRCASFSGLASFNTCRAITSRCTSEVPSPIVHNFASRR